MRMTKAAVRFSTPARTETSRLLSVEPTQISPYYLLWYTACNGGLLNEVNDGAGGYVEEDRTTY